MGESQVPYAYTPVVTDAIHQVMSEDRMSRYVKRAGGDKDWALAIYLYNARLAKALLFPLSAVEVAVRNAVDDVLVRKYGEDWHLSGDFRDTVLSEGGQTALERAFERASSRDRGQIIATLTFDFWSNIFRSEYHDLWRVDIGRAFPHLTPGKGRTDIQTIVKKINNLRNRVAHHEPVLDLNISDDLAKIYQIIEYRCPETSKWVRHHTTVNSVLRTFPKRGSVAVHAAHNADTHFHEATQETSLFEMAEQLVARQAPFVVTNDGKVTGAVTPEQLAEYISAKAVECSGMIDLNDHSVADVLGRGSNQSATAILNSASPMQMAIQELTKARTKLLVLTGDDDRPVGVIARAHRRY